MLYLLKKENAGTDVTLDGRLTLSLTVSDRHRPTRRLRGNHVSRKGKVNRAAKMGVEYQLIIKPMLVIFFK